MINLIMGKRGTGKSKKVIELANSSTEKVPGEVVFINKTNKHMYDLNYKVRLINTIDFNIEKFDTFFGFLCGIISENYDVNHIYVDGLLKIVSEDLDCAKSFFIKLDEISKKFNINFTFTITAEAEEAPEFVKEYVS